MKSKIHSWFPTYDDPNVKKFYVVSGLHAAAFTNIVWLFFVQIHLTNTAIGLLEISALLFGLFVEIPSGAFAGTGLLLLVAAFLFPVVFKSKKRSKL